MKIPALDHGYVEHIESWGLGRQQSSYDEVIDYEVGIVEAARQSTQGSFRGWEQDAKLLKHLYENKHETPFEFAGMVIEVQAPIFVFREWHRHRTQSYNEMSARYAPLPGLYYRPSADAVYVRGLTSTSNKQSQGSGEIDQFAAKDFCQFLDEAYERAEQVYQGALKHGIPKELARLVMPVGHYSRMRASANLRNWLAFLTLRMDPKAQWEIRMFANAVGQIITKQFPQTWKLFIDRQVAENG